MSHDPSSPDETPQADEAKAEAPAPEEPRDTPTVHTSDPVADEEPPTPEAPPEEPEPMEALPLRGTARPEPQAVRTRPDPFAQAHEVLARAAAARGAEFTPLPPARRSPLEAAQEALEKARAAREHAAAGGSRGLAREAEARAQLEQLKRHGTAPVPSSSSPRSGDSGNAPPDDGPPTPKKRRL